MVKDNCFIITPLSPKLAVREVQRIEEELNNIGEQKIAFNLACVNDCTIEFIERIKNYKNISLFNIHSDIFAILTSMNLDKSIKLFVSEMDFLNDKHQLINRKFSLIQ